MSEENIINENLKEKMIKRLELELGLPLTPKSSKELEKDFKGSEILVNNFPIHSVNIIKINGNIIPLDDCLVLEDEGIIYLPKEYAGKLYIEYIYGIPEYEYEALVDLMIEYENDTDWKKDASSIKEINVSVSYDTSLGKGALIQQMITDLRNRYNCLVRMI